MKPLSATLNAMKSPEDLPKDAPLGLTTTDTRTISVQRSKPLAENELTRTASKLLRAEPSIVCEKSSGYETKIDQHGATIQVPTESEFDLDIVFPLIANPDPKWLETALRVSPSAAAVAHLTRLSLHKILGSTDQDRQILLHDYADALAHFPDFVLYSVCRAFWQDNGDKFYPKIAVLKKFAHAVRAQLETALRTPEQIEKPKPKPRAVREEDSDRGKRRRQHLIDFLRATPGTERALEFVNDHSPSNYSLEGSAKRFGWQGYPPDFEQGY